MKNLISFSLSLLIIVSSLSCSSSGSYSREFTETEAMNFLFEYMPLADVADHPDSFFLENVRTSFKARKEMPWGKSIPEKEFRHFVLPIRVNNEDLDNSRMVFYDELKDRVCNMNMYDAVLEINHWCHEKVTYTPSDARTSSPLATIRTGHGRCGEEATLAVAALRAMCIPARQVYTPRWAHTDDNHAWVEAWVDGTWYFLGACEPEPVLNLAWFNAPVSRGMLMHTKAFGKYDGPEEIIRYTGRYTEINVTANYAPVAKASIKVIDSMGNPVSDALIEFKIYNYGEFHTVSEKKSNKNGITYLSAGKGDMLVWASKDGLYGFNKVTFGKDEVVDIILDKKINQKGYSNTTISNHEFNIVPPPEREIAPKVTDKQREENNRRFAEENSIRNAYLATFPDKEQRNEYATKLLSKWEITFEDKAKANKEISHFIKASQGNYKAIMEFMNSLQTKEEIIGGLDILQRISQKDLRDVRSEVLMDHLRHDIYCKSEIEKQYIRNPRISTELLTEWKSGLTDAISNNQDFNTAEKLRNYRNDPTKLAVWTIKNIKVDTMCNIGAAPISPMGVWKTRKADVKSRDIFFIALARTIGIPAQIDPITGKVQVWVRTEVNNNKEWSISDIDFKVLQNIHANNAIKGTSPTGVLKLSYTPDAFLDNPKYYSHFTISKINKNGSISLLNYEEGELDMGGGTTWTGTFKNGVRVEAGSYLLVTGTRLANGSVLCNSSIFNIEENKTTTVPLILRRSESEIQVIGNFNSESRFIDSSSKTSKSILDVSGRGYFTVGILGMGQEPTNHALRDIASRKQEFEKWGRCLVLLFPNKENLREYEQSEFPSIMPSTVVCGIDDGTAIQKEITREMKLNNKSQLPIFIIGDTFNRVVFSSQGYTIGLGDQIIDVSKKL